MLFDLLGQPDLGQQRLLPGGQQRLRGRSRRARSSTLPLVWGGLTSEPTCTVARGTPAAGSYLVRGRLDTRVSADAPLTLA